MISEEQYLQAERRVCIMGVYGKGNLGDEALLKAVSLELKTVWPQAEFLVFCSDAPSVQDMHSMLAYSRKPSQQFFKKLRLLSQSHVLLFGGGTLLYDQGTWIKNLKAVAALFFWPILARLMGVPCVAYGQGVGPARQGVTRWALRYLFPLFQLITLRDQLSGDLVRQGMKGGKNIRVTCDCVAASDYFTQVQGGDREAYALVAFRLPQAAGRELIKQWSLAVAEFHEQSRLPLMLFPVQLHKDYVEDELVLQEVRTHLLQHGVAEDKINMAHWDTMEQATQMLQSAQVVVSNRLHALLLAAKAGVPVVGIGGRDKIRGCLQMIGESEACQFVDQDDFDVSRCRQAVVQAAACTTDARKGLQQAVRDWCTTEPTNPALLRDAIK